MKKKTMELIILIVLIIIFILTCCWTFKIFNYKKSNEVTNTTYEVPKSYYFTRNTISDLNIPSWDIISNYTYRTRIDTTDNIIKFIYEEIDITYYTKIDSNIKSYCNKYNKVENEYIYECSYQDNEIHIKHNYYIDRITDSKIISNTNTIDIIATKNMKYTKYLELRNNEEYQETTAF